MTEIKKSKLSLLWVGIWSIILLEIPFIIKLVKYKCMNYKYDSENVYVKKGVFDRTETIIPIYKIESARGRSNIFGYGTITIHSGAKGIAGAYLEFVSKPLKITREINEMARLAKESKGVKHVDTF